MQKVAKTLLEIQAIKINNTDKFKWSSGILSPIYTDNRLITGYPKERQKIEKIFAKLILKHFPDVECILGTATAGIAHAAYLSQLLKLPMGYVRSKAKVHGDKKQIEGLTNLKGKKVVIIEDLLSTGQSALKVVAVLQAAQANILGVGTIFSYNLAKLKANFKTLKYFAMTNLQEVLKVAHEQNYIQKQDIELVESFIAELKG